MRLFQCGLHLVRVGKIFLAHRCRRNVHHVAPTLLIFNGATEWMTSQCHQTESPASSFGMLVNASINSGCHCSDTGNTLPGATPHSSSSGTSSSSGRNSTYAIASGMGTTCSSPDRAAYQRALSSHGMSKHGTFGGVVHRVLFNFRTMCRMRGSYCARLPLKTLAKTR